MVNPTGEINGVLNQRQSHKFAINSSEALEWKHFTIQDEAIQ